MIKNRLVDLALILGLVLIAGAIVWTLFSLGTGPRSQAPDAGPAAADGPSVEGGEVAGDVPGGAVVPVAPGGEAAPGAGLADAPGGAGGPQALPPGAPDPDGAPGDGGLAAADAADDAVDAADPGDAAADVDPDAPAPDRPDPTVAAEDAPSLPSSGPAALGRVGFSFVTGGAGACGIVLEPWTHVAVSRELLEAYGCGAEVTVTLDDPADGRTSVDAVVADTMNPSFSRTVNVYVGEDEPAFDYGLTAGTIQPR